MATVRIQVRRGTAADWTSVHPVLAPGEVGFESDTRKMKVGDGTSNWTQLDYIAADAPAISEIAEDAIYGALTLGSGLSKSYDDALNKITLNNTGVLSFNTRTGAVTLSDTDITDALGYTPADAADLSSLGSQTSTDISNAITTAENYTDSSIATEVTNRNSAIATAKSEAITAAESYADSKVLTEENERAASIINAIQTAEGYTDDAISNLVSTAPSTLNTLKEIADAITADEGTAASLATTVGGKVSKSGDVMSGILNMGANRIVNLDNPFNDSDAVRKSYADQKFAPIDSPVFTGSVTLPSGTVTSQTIADHEIKAINIANGAVGYDAIASGAIKNENVSSSAAIAYSKLNLTGAITTTDIVDGSITSAKILDGSITSAKILDGSITSAKILDESITSAKILDESITSAKIANETIVNSNISSSAEIDQSKIAGLSNSFNAKADTSSPTFTGTVVLPDTTSIGNVTQGEILYLHGVTSAIQTQFTSAQTSLSDHVSLTTNVHGISDTSALATKAYADNAVGVETSNRVTAVSGAITTAEGYTDTAISTEVTNRNSAILTAKSDAETYADGLISTEVTNRNSAIATAKSQAITAAELYADNLATNYDAAGSATTAKNDAETYADGLISTEVTNRNSAIATAKSQAITTAEGYTDNVISNLVNGAPSTLDTLAEIASALGSDANLSTTLTNSIALKAPIASPTFTGTVSGVTKAMVGLGNVDNTSDANKPVSTAAQTALDAKAPLASPTFTGTVTLPTGTVTSAMILDGTINTADIADSAITSAKIANGTIVNADVNASAAIDYSKLNLASSITSSDILDGTIVNADINASAAIAATKISGTAVTQADTGTVTSTMIADGTIVNADVSLSAAIADTKLATISTSGKVSNSATTATDANTASAIVARDASGNFTANLITVNTTPTSAGHAASKSYVDSLAAGINWHDAVKYATSTNISAVYANGTAGVGATLTASANGAIGTIDGQSVSLNDRVLVAAQTDATTNGIYTVTSLGGVSSKWVLTRATDADNHIAGQVSAGDSVYTLSGTNYGNIGFVLTSTGTGTNGAIVIGTDNINWTQFTGAASFVAGAGLLRSGNTVDVVSSTLTVSADSVDLPTVSRSNTTGSATNNLISSITTDTYGRVTAAVTSPINVATSSQQGVATFNTASFTVTSGDVTIKSGGVSNTQLANSSVTVGTTAIALGASSTTLAGLTSVTSTGFTGALTGNADTATKLATTRAINGVNFDGSAAITVKASTTNALTIGTGLSGTSFDGSGAVTIAIDSTVATLSGTQTLTGKTFDTAGTGNVFKIAGTQISANTGTGSNVLAASPTLSGTLSAAAITTTGDVTVGGNLTVNGTTTTINSTTLNTTEQVLVISNTATPTDVTANGAGITIKGATDKTIKWYSSTGALTSSENIDLASGKTYKINGTDVLTATAVGGRTIPASNIVGLTDTQTLTNKTLTSPSISTPTVSSGTLTVSSSGVTFSDATVQTTAGVASLTTIGTAISASNGTYYPSQYRDQMVPISGTYALTIAPDGTNTAAIGTSVDFYQSAGTGGSFVAGAGVTILSTPGLKLRTTGSVATIMKTAANTWLLFGDLSA